MPQRRLRRSAGALVLLALAACSHGSSTASAPRPTASSTPTAGVPTPTPTPAGTAVYPLTGLPVTSPAAARGPALAVKIDNISAARPQVGLNAADLVVDTPVEGGLRAECEDPRQGVRQVLLGPVEQRCDRPRSPVL